jgi:hypothetical protein
MTNQPKLQLNNKILKAITDLEQIISQKYPSVTFEVAKALDDPNIIHLFATVDLDDTDEVADLVINRVVDYVAAGVPVHVIPLRTSERIQQYLRDRTQKKGASHSSSRKPLFDTLPFPQS